jgi:pimeloyl-ACP methyl ester carboxylesterase
MQRRYVLMLFFLLSGLAAAQGEPQPVVSSGRIVRLSDVPSTFVDRRNVDVWLPDGYTSAKRYRVIYMNDGQALFDGRYSLSHQAWVVADTAARLIRNGKLDDVIVVGIWNNGKYRHSEYFPQKALAYLPDAARSAFVDGQLAGAPRADAYLRFIVEELKPLIDGRFATLPDRDHTLIMGSSMGAMISLYAISEYPQVFGAAGCLSTHWLGGFDDSAVIPLATFDYLRDRIPDPATHRIYMDHGTLGLDAHYAVHQQFFDLMMRDRGYTDLNYSSRVFPGAGHDEGFWAARLDVPLIFLAGKAGATPGKAGVAPLPDDPVLGTWKLNVEKSTFAPGPGWKSQIRVYKSTSAGIAVTWVGVGAKDERMRVSYVYNYDGKDYPLAGSGNYDALAAEHLDALTVRSVEKRDGKAAGTAMLVVSPDGKILTVTDDGTNRKGEAFSQVLVFDRQ